ncbi:MAG TPA: DUF503 domain-containing protein [Thermoanaerobacterales bacterium]|nr:DUF503 domain-containing protein [Thermoanaerobacterales bacterium]
MIVGTATIDLIFYEPNSLKDKRRIVKSLIETIKGKYNVSIGEVGFQDTWKNARLGIACVSTETSHANSIITSVINFIERDGRVIIQDYYIEIL